MFKFNTHTPLYSSAVFVNFVLSEKIVEVTVLCTCITVTPPRNF